MWCHFRIVTLFRSVLLSLLRPCLILRLSVLFIKPPHKSFLFYTSVHLGFFLNLLIKLFVCFFHICPLSLFPSLFHIGSSSLRPVRMVTRSIWNTCSSMGQILPPRMLLETLPCTSVLYITRQTHCFHGDQMPASLEYRRCCNIQYNKVKAT